MGNNHRWGTALGRGYSATVDCAPCISMPSLCHHMQVPRCKSRAMAGMINFLVERMAAGHNVKDGQKVQDENYGLFMRLKLLTTEERAVVVEIFSLQRITRGGAGLMLMLPMFPSDPSDDPAKWGCAPPGTKVNANPGARP